MNGIPDSKKNSLLRGVEWTSAVIGAAVCLIVVLVFSSQQASDLWPLPGLYFIEITLLAIFGAASRILAANQTNPILRAAPWITAGVLFPFVILGIFSIGLFILPAMLAFFLSGLTADMQRKKGFAGHFSLAVMSALLQGVLMIAVNMIFVSGFQQ
jgi:hypothetical protein